MIRRFRLEQKSHYEKLVIAQRLSDMIDKFLSGRHAPLSIGAEKGGIEEWDDVVILHSSDLIEHLQVKRQTTDFCNKNPDKTKHKVKAPKEGAASKAPADSVIDSAFSSLAKHARLGTFNSRPNRNFQLTLVGAHLKIKKNLTVDHLDALCKLCRLDGLDLVDLANRKDGPTERTYLWLKTWCGFNDWSEIRDTLRRVTIVCVGNDTALEQRSAESLSRYFTDPEKALKSLITYITSETSDVSALSCHAVVRALKHELRPDIDTWVQYMLSDEPLLTGKSWSLAGTYDLGSLTPRSGQGVVEHMWSSESRNRKLRIYAPYTSSFGANLTLPSAIMRMALHLPNGSQSLILGETAWRVSVGNEVGHTLGCAENDLSNLHWIENSEPLVCSLSHEFSTQSAARSEADALANAMDEFMWQMLAQGVYEKFALIKDPALANEMEMLWQTWMTGFVNNPESRRKFLEQLLYPETEGKNVEHAFRLGPRTVGLLVSAVEVLLLVAVGIGGSGADWNSFPNCGQVLSIALKYWSGPAGSVSEVRELSDDNLMAVIGASPAPVVILSGVSASPSALLDIGMADDVEAATSMAAERQPLLLVTRSGIFNYLRNGDLASVRQYFNKQWQDRQLARESAIEANTKGL
ncbi:ABC-three component system protein [Marinomonas lutimaris]|uniref:ABC-three component system protein n=1 Tax=Marinomonas lutimaris TaxID=2846746 RepID=UPI001CA5E812|nr:ABC-three component system protein [Marinomonas lutimaris]